MTELSESASVLRCKRMNCFDSAFMIYLAWFCLTLDQNLSLTRFCTAITCCMPRLRSSTTQGLRRCLTYCTQLRSTCLLDPAFFVFQSRFIFSWASLHYSFEHFFNAISASETQSNPRVLEPEHALLR